MTARGPVDPSALGRVLMHEHLHSDIYRWASQEFVTAEAPATPERRAYLLREAVPHLKACHAYGCHAYCDVTMPPWRAWPDLYREVADAADFHIVVATGFYREMEIGKYWVKKPEDRIWPFVVSSSEEALAEFCTREILEGLHGTPLRAGVIKLGSSAAAMTELEQKTFRAGARAQKATGVHITTHCTALGGETSQLRLLDREGVDLRRVVIGHTASHLSDPQHRKVCLEWMARGANFLPTNLGIPPGDPSGRPWRGLIDGIHEAFDAGHGDKLVLGLDSGYCSESKEFGPMTFLPPPPWLHMFTHTLPAFRALGLLKAEEEMIMERNPQRILPVQ
jgi:phosphotriesterase-related protein